MTISGKTSCHRSRFLIKKSHRSLFQISFYYSVTDVNIIILKRDKCIHLTKVNMNDASNTEYYGKSFFDNII